MRAIKNRTTSKCDRSSIENDRWRAFLAMSALSSHRAPLNAACSDAALSAAVSWFPDGFFTCLSMRSKNARSNVVDRFCALADGVADAAAMARTLRPLCTVSTTWIPFELELLMALKNQSDFLSAATACSHSAIDRNVLGATSPHPPLSIAMDSERLFAMRSVYTRLKRRKKRPLCFVAFSLVWWPSSQKAIVATSPSLASVQPFFFSSAFSRGQRAQWKVSFPPCVCGSSRAASTIFFKSLGVLAIKGGCLSRGKHSGAAHNVLLRYLQATTQPLGPQ